MSIEIRPATEQEMSQLGLLTAYVYGGAFGDAADNLPARSNRPEWTLCAFDGPRMVTSYSAIPFTMRANGTGQALAGVSVVGTLPEYRRRGLLRRITELSFAQMRERGQGVAALWASQAAIYQRYGYSRGSLLRQYAIDTVDILLQGEADDGLTVARQPLNEAFDVMRETYREFVGPRTLYLHRSRPLWQAGVLRDDAADGPVHVAICRDASANARGYVAYTVRANKVAHRARQQELVIRDLVWLDADAYRALWRFIGCHDLVGRVVWRNAPSDDPAVELFVEPRLLDVHDAEGVWVRIVDVEQALAGRAYSADGEIVVGIEADACAPWNQGNYQLTVAGAEVAVRRTRTAPDITLSTKALASAYTGFQPVRRLADMGLIDGKPAALAAAERLFATRYAPHCPDHF